MNNSGSAVRSARIFLATCAGLMTGLPGVGAAQSAGSSSEVPIEADGTVNVPAFALPPSIYISEQAKAALPRKPVDAEAPMVAALAAGKAGEMRGRMAEYMAPKFKHYAELFPVTREETTIAGVQAIYYRPAAGIPRGNASKILLNLPGGGFVMGHAAGTGMQESVPLAAMLKTEIVSITYRQGPEYKFPAASEDIAKVYRELLKTHRPQDIAIFGCSAGGALTAEAMAWFLKEKLPLPGAIGISCASADQRPGGDSRYYSRSFQRLAPDTRVRDYFEGADRNDPLVSPIVSPEILRQFPPTLLITATRAQELSGAVNTHRELVKAGVDAELHVWDGLGHFFYGNIDLPEAREAYDVMARFYRKHLKLVQ